MFLPLLADASSWFGDHWVPIVGAAVVVLALAVFGLTDLARFSASRIWAISGVCFAESIRRRVLWIIPLAVVALIAIVQLQQPTDEQDAIRQTTKFCLLASGLVVVLTTLILACTNLPREIENRVIFTVVTKPTTRLEIVLGKIVGFARVSFTILVVMGLFTWGYLHLRAGLLTHDLRQRLAEPGGGIQLVSRGTSEHYVEAGLLNAKTFADARALNIYGRPPVQGSTRRYLNPDGYLLIPFALPPDLIAFADPKGEQYKGPGFVISLRLGYDPVPAATSGPAAAAAAATPAVTVQVFDPNANLLLGSNELEPSKPLPIPSADGQTSFRVTVPVVAASRCQGAPFIFVAVSPAQVGVPLWVDDDPAHRPASLLLPVLNAKEAKRLEPTDPADPSKPGALTFTGREGTFGQQAKGDAAGAGQTAVFEFRGATGVGSGGGDMVPIEMRVGIEKNAEGQLEDSLTDVKLTVIDPATGRQADVKTIIHPENNRTLYGSVPADLCRSGDFDVAVRCLSPDQWVGMRSTSLSVVRASSTFGWNLAKSLFVLWLLSILVTTISVFCSTFLTWPTAVVFTLVLLFGRWGLNALGDAAAAGLGRSFVNDFGIKDPTLGLTVASSVETLNKTFKAVAGVLPDIGSFSATDDIDRGVSIPLRTLGDAAGTLFGYGLPLTALAFVILKNKEVAP